VPERTWVEVEVDAGSFAILAPPTAGMDRNDEFTAAALDVIDAAAKGELDPVGAESSALQRALCESVESTSGAGPIIRLFPTWPAQWDAKFELLCEGGFLVSAAMEQGGVTAVEVECVVREQMGAELRLWNPWGEACPVRVIRKGESNGILYGPLLRFRMPLGERVRFEPVVA
jgi:hypothetical protein